MPKKLMQSESIIINIMNQNFSEWNEKNIPIFLTLLGIQEACELDQANSINIWFTIGVIEKIINSKSIYMPNWLANYMKCSDFLPIYHELKEIAQCKVRPIYSYPEVIDLINLTGDFSFKIMMPLEMPSKNPEKWIKWCFIIKLLFHYNKNPYPMDFLASRGIFNNQLIIYPDKQIALNFLIDYYQKILPKLGKIEIPNFPDYDPPYLEIQKREYLWSHPKREGTINLRKMVWFNILSYMAGTDRINRESLLKGVNALISVYKERNEHNLLRAIGNCMGLIFSHFDENYKKRK